MHVYYKKGSPGGYYGWVERSFLSASFTFRGATGQKGKQGDRETDLLSFVFSLVLNTLLSLTAVARQVLSMVQEGKLDVGGNSPQKLCLVAICYHNMAVSATTV